MTALQSRRLPDFDPRTGAVDAVADAIAYLGTESSAHVTGTLMAV